MGRTRFPIKLVPRVFDEEMKDPGNEFGCYILYHCYAINNNDKFSNYMALSKTCLNGLIKYQRNSSEQIFLAERTTEYKGYLVNQGYPSKLVVDQFLKASTMPRSDLLRTCVRSKTTCHPNFKLPDVARVIRKHQVILESNPK